MKDISNNSIVLFMCIVLVFALIVNYAVLDKEFNRRAVSFTGAATQGMVQMCINHEPAINHSCSDSASIGVLYTCDFDAFGDTYQNLTFYDNSSFFIIDPSTRIISFTPLSENAGIHYINITATDNSSCSNYASYLNFTLNITSGLNIMNMGLVITKTGAHGAYLNWSNTTGAANYNVYYSGNVSSLRSLNYSDITNVSSINGLYLNDTTADTASQRFYRVVAANETGEILSTEIAGKYDLQMISNADGSLGRNLFSVPFNMTNYADQFLSEVCRYSGTITRLNRQDPSYENYESHSCSSGSYNNYSMSLGEAFFMYVNTSYNYTVVGMVPNESLTLHFISNPTGSLGRNLFGLHFPLQDQYADPFLTTTSCSYASTITRLNRQDPSYENYESHSCSSGSYNNYSMLPGQGCYMYINTSYDYIIS
jgi:hypothetical protein